MTPVVLIWIAAISGLVACFTAIGARALREYSRHELEEICQKRKRTDLFSTILHDDDQVALGIENLATIVTVLAVVAGVLAAGQHFGFADVLSVSTFLILIAGMAIAMLAANVWVPFAASRLGAARFLYHTWPLWRFLSTLIAPVAASGRLLDTISHRLAGRKHAVVDEDSFEEEIRTIVSEGQREGLLEEDAREMIEGVMELSDGDVSSIMTPRTDIHMLQAQMPWDEMLAQVIELRHTRIPVYDKNRDDIIGLLYSKDLLPTLAKNNEDTNNNGKLDSWAELLRKPIFIPESKAVDDLLQMFQQSHTHIAVVLDEYGGVSGLVTIEDVLEEIVGEIIDEYDEDVEEDIKQIDNDICEALGRAHVDEINETMGYSLPEDADFDTIGGFVFSELGRVPLSGEELTWQDLLRVTVLEATRRRIERVRIERISEQSREIA